MYIPGLFFFKPHFYKEKEKEKEKEKKKEKRKREKEGKEKKRKRATEEQRKRGSFCVWRALLAIKRFFCRTKYQKKQTVPLGRQQL